jgi:dolichol kinase
MKKEFFRKSVHTLLALCFVFIAPYAQKELLIYSALLLFVIFLMLRMVRFFHFVKTPRVSYGELFFALGILIAVQLSWPNIALFQLAILVLAFSDPVAALVGIPFGKHTYTILDEKRSLEGSTACLIVTVLLLIIFGVPLIPSIIISVVVATMEAFSLRGSDNLMLPISVILLMSIV